MLEKKLLLVEFPWGRDKDPRVPLGHASILAMVSTIADIKCKSFVKPINAKDFNLEQVKREILQELSTLGKKSDIAFGVYVWCEDVIKSILSYLRLNNFEGRIILGGPQISYSEAGLEQIYPEADIFVRGYGEFAIAELMTKQNKINHTGVHYAGESDKVEQTIVDLDLCPSPWLEGIIKLEDQSFIRWETQRGCQFKCSFCQHKEAGSRLPKHMFQFNRIEQEIDLFCRKKVEDIAILDPIFNSGKQAIKILKRFYENEYDGRLSIQCRAEMITDEFIQYASKLNVRLEFGLQTIHENEGIAINRRNNFKMVQRNLAKVKQAGINFEVSVIYGLPEQTLESFRNTIDWCLSMKIPVIKAFPLMLLRGTEIEKQKHLWGLIESNDTMPVVIESNTFTNHEWLQMGNISQVLKESENTHPRSIELLEEMMDESNELQHERFQPIISGIESPVLVKIKTP
jgi:radical SAM superfamily enzyme YgiQ (UPF0313 family)